MIREIFSTDRKFWTPSFCDEVSLFFQFNPFFSPFYEVADFQKIVDITYFTKLNQNASLLLQNNKKPQAIILLAGKVDVYKKIFKEKIKKIKNKMTNLVESTEKQIYQTYELVASLSQANQYAIVGADCKVSVSNKSQAEILFVPLILYNQYMNVFEQKKTQIIFKTLKTFFPYVQKKTLINLAKEGCYFKQFKINDVVYRAGSLPEEVYLLTEGNIKLQKQSFSSRRTFEIVIIDSSSMFGQKDIKLSHRQQSAIVCSAYAKTLAIPKRQFLRFAKDYLKDITFMKQQQSGYSLPILKNNGKSLYAFEDKRDRMKRLFSNSKVQDQQLIESKIAKNCHMLFNLSPKNSKTSRFDASKEKDYSKDQFEEKMKLFQKIRPNARIVDFSNPIIDFLPRKTMTFRSQFFQTFES